MRLITILRRKSKLGYQGWPKATLAFYGPDDRKATKAVLGIFKFPEHDGDLYRFFSDDRDARYRIDIQEAILACMQSHGIKSLIMVEKIFGCPHQEGEDYPIGESCPHCPFRKGRDRSTALE